jgi:hypothetical protein
MDSVTANLKSARHRCIVKMLGYSAACLLLIIVGYILATKLPNSNYTTLTTFIMGIIAAYCASVVPYYYKLALHLKIEIKNHVKIWELIDQDGNVFAAYSTFDEMKKDNQEMFESSVEEMQYVIKNRETGESKGIIDYKHYHHWDDKTKEI